jgi:predicted dienelactone hydrolase
MEIADKCFVFKREVVMRQIRVLIALVVIPLFVSACMPVQPQSTDLALVGLRPDAPEYGRHGPFWVGYKPLVIGEGTEDQLNAAIWYPATNPKGLEEKVTYELKPHDPSEPADSSMVIYGHALLNAESDASQGPYPLVVFSHGFAVDAAAYSPLVEHYASQGFIVLAPQHIEQFDPTLGDLWKSSIDRPRDVQQTLNYAEQLAAPGGDMAGLIDMQHVAVVGHSSGGYTALAMAGAQYDLAAFNARCAQLPQDDPHTALCTPLVPHEADMAARAGLDPMPEGLWPSFGDPRVTAIISMAGDSYLFDKAGLSKITIPVLVMGGTADTGTPYAWGAQPTYEDASSTQKALVTFTGAEHMIFMTPCENQPGITPDFPPYVFFCLDPVWDKARALDLINHFSTAFLLDTLKGDEAAQAALELNAVNFPGIEYTTTK